MSVMGIDPATLTGWAYRDRGDKWHFGRCKINLLSAPPDGNPPDILTVLRTAAEAGVTRAAIEDAYLDLNPHTFKVLSEIVGVIIASCGTAGIKHTMVPAMTWKHAMLTVNGWFPPARAAQKASALWTARHVFKAPVKYHDEADAVCLCEWGRVHWALDVLEKRGNKND